MKNLIKGTLCKCGLILFLLMFSFSGKAQTQYTMSMTATATTNTIDVSLTITATNPSGVRFGGYSAGINYNTAIVNGGTISAAYVPGTKSAELSNLNPAAVNTATAGQIRLPIQSLSGTNGVDMAQGTTLNLGTYRITNTVAWAEGSDAALWLQNVLASGKTNSLVNGYPFGATTPATSYTTTVPVAGALALAYTSAVPLSLSLNVPSETCFTSGTASNILGTTCFGQTTGSAIITMSPAASNNTITYTVDGGTSTPGTLVANAFSVSGLTAGPHEVVVTGSGGCTTPVSVTFTIGGPTSELTNTTTETACGSYYWSVTDTTYSTSGTYTGTTTNGSGCTVNETLNLTITELTTTGSVTTSICAGDSYTWPANGLSYTTAQTNVIHTVGCNIATLNLTINANSTPTVSLTSSDLDNTFSNGTSVTFTASAGSVGGGTITYNFKLNGGSVQSGASNTYTVSTLANNDQVSVDITVIGGICLTTTTANSNTIVNTVTVTAEYFASVISYCGLTMPKLASTIYCSIPSGVVGTLTYRFKVRKTGTLDVESIVNRTVNSFNLSLLPTIASFGTSYDVRVAAVVNGVEQPFSAVCVVTTPVAIPLVQINQCGGTLATLNSIISVNALAGATSFRYIVASSVTPTDFFTLTSPNSSFRLTDVPLLLVNYNSTYSVSAQQLVTSGGVSTWSPLATCNLTTPSVANAINLQVNQCGQTLPTVKSKITVNSIANATLYTFRVSTTSDFSSPVEDITSSYSKFSMNSLTTVPLDYNTQYYVKVKVSVTINGVTTESNFGTPCSFFTPTSAPEKVNAEPFVTIEHANPFTAIAYPNPFAENFMIDITTSKEENISIKVYDMIGRLIEQRESTVNDLETSTLGNNYPSGVYNIIVSQRSEIKSLRVIKR
ncbi:MAG: T9SS type A sorting domain-containing protein [Flavobacterium sp. JAD_PAG50586_2]|nr:MAG: T9SS type A sorting domain-containing protein [Flavobacterium sp. JAD_PAG50586_2]